MRAYTIDGGFGFEHLQPSERPEPSPGPGEVLVRVRAVSLNYRDLLVIEGAYNSRLPLPLVPCSDGAGEVVAVGAGVTRVKVGDRVCGIFMQEWLAGELTAAKARSALGGERGGMLAEMVALPQEGVVPIPEHLSFEEAATLPCAAVTAWHALVSEDGLKAGDTVLVQGTGGVSMFALQFAVIHGARVLITSRSDAKLERARQLGAAETINSTTTPDWDKPVRELTRGVGVDHVVEVGGAGTLERSLKAVKVGGRVALIGVLSGTGTFNPLPLLMRNIRLQGIFVGSREMFEAMNRAIELHRLRPIVDRVFPFAETGAALEHLRSGAHFGKVVVQV